MKATIVIPTYWAGPAGETTDKLLNIYDHPTPLDENGTLERTLESLTKLNGHFNVCIIGTMTEEAYFNQFEEKLRAMLDKFSDRLNLYWFSNKELESFHAMLDSQGLSYNKKYVSLEGYSNIRNLCIIIPQLLGSEVAILIDDDEVVTDPDLIAKATDYMGGEFDGQKIIGKTGYYVDGEGRHMNEQKTPWWDCFWKKGYLMNEVNKTIKEEPRLKKTPLALGGAMVIHRDLFTQVSFDPWITRGEDIDYLINAKLKGIDFFLDNELSFVHLPPAKKSRFLGCRQDYYRFIYERMKLKAAFKMPYFERFNIEELDAYPGRLLRAGVFVKAFATACILAIRGIFVPEERNQYKNIWISAWSAPRYAWLNRRNYFRFQRGWPSFMKHISVDFGDIVKKISNLNSPIVKQ